VEAPLVYVAFTILGICLLQNALRYFPLHPKKKIGCAIKSRCELNQILDTDLVAPNYNNQGLYLRENAGNKTLWDFRGAQQPIKVIR
jgi:hypothetical protein